MRMDINASALSDFIGQEKLIAQLADYVVAAKDRGEMPEHVLISGPGGLGKTRLARIVAEILGGEFREKISSAVDKVGPMAKFLMSIKSGVVLIDEIHRLKAVAEELLYGALQDGVITVEGIPKPVEIPPFTLIGATTLPGKLSVSLRDRFKFKGYVDYYSTDELANIIWRAAFALGIRIEDDAAEFLAVRSRGTPRRAEELLGHARNRAQLKATARGEHGLPLVITLADVDEAMTLHDIDVVGLDEFDRKVLEYIAVQRMGTRVGVDAIGRGVGTDPSAALAYLDRIGLVGGSGNGRTATSRAYPVLGLDVPAVCLEWR